MSNYWNGLLLVLGILMLCISVPYIVYVSVKLAGYGWLRGRQLFFDEEKGRKHED